MTCPSASAGSLSRYSAESVANCKLVGRLFTLASVPSLRALLGSLFGRSLRLRWRNVRCSAVSDCWRSRPRGTRKDSISACSSAGSCESEDGANYTCSPIAFCWQFYSLPFRGYFKASWRQLIPLSSGSDRSLSIHLIVALYRRHSSPLCCSHQTLIHPLLAACPS